MDSLEELKIKHDKLDNMINDIAESRGYAQLESWNGYVVYDIPIMDLSPVRSSVMIRKVGLYSKTVNNFLNGYKPTCPLLCFIASDLSIKVKHGNLICWVAKETKQLTSLPCIFPKGSDIDTLLSKHKDCFGIKNDERYL